MGLFRSQAATKPTALGTMLQSSTYGSVLYSIFGCMKAPPLPIWAANLRPGSSSKKGKKKGKKGRPPAYVENIDMFVGNNPISNILDIWSNTSNHYPLNFTSVTVSGISFSGSPPFGAYITFTDPNFYAVVAVTAEVTLSGTFNDYGAPPGGVAYSGTYEYPLWNSAFHGPDLVQAAGARWWPYVYYWIPTFGTQVFLPFYQDSMAPGNGIPNGNGVYHIYYAQLSATLKRKSPLAYNRFLFETQLGNGSEYSDAGLPGQQDIKPAFAGVESSDMDLGSAGAIPAWRFEVQGSYSFLQPRGDAEYADMIEDIVKSGQIQTGLGLSLVPRGVNCNSLPGVVQTGFYGELEPHTPNHIPYYQPNAAGSILIAFFRWRPSGGSPPTISDTASDTWNSVLTSANCGLWWATSVGSPAQNIVQSAFNGLGFAYDSRGYIFEMDPGSNTVDSTAVSQGTTSGPNQVISATIYATRPCFLFVAVETGSLTGPLPAQWDSLTVGSTLGFGPVIMKRYVTQPGAYTFSLTVTLASTAFNIGMLAIGGQPSPIPKTLGNIIDDDALFQVRLQDRAGGLQGSLCMDAQRPAADWIGDIVKCADAAPVWDGFKLYFIPRSEVSAVGNGAVFIAPTAGGPIIDLTRNNFVGDASTAMIVVEHNAPSPDAENIDQIQCFSRTDNYNQAMIAEPQTANIAIYGPRPVAPLALPMIVDPAVGRRVAIIEGRRRTMVLPTIFRFTLQPNFIFLRAMSFVTLTDELINLFKQPARLTSVVENDKGEFVCEAEPFIYGVHSPNPLIAPSTAPYQPAITTIPADVNPPIFLEPVPRLESSSPQSTASSPQQLWIVVSDSDPNYGGAIVLLSTDGGASYNPIGQTVGSAITGHTTADWPIANDPDTANSLPVDLTESLGVLSSYSAADRDSFTYPCYIDHGTAAIPYGLMTYNMAVLTATNKYTLLATGTGNELRRCVFGAPQPLTDVDHPNGSRWAFLNPAGTGIFKINLDPKWIGVTLYFKFLAYNIFQSAVEDQASATAYPYTPTGVAQAAEPSSFIYTITGGALTNPTPTTIHMAQATATSPGGSQNYNARTFTIPAPSVPTTYYVTIYDPQHIGDTGSLTNLSAYAEMTTAKVGQPGYIFIGSIVVLPAGGGTVTGAGGSNPQGAVFVNGVEA